MFGNKDNIPGADMAKVCELAQGITKHIQWHSGDVAILDNHRVMHGRTSFTGQRKVYASLIRS